ncbi:hypothetical protein ACWDV6_52435, partial [Rhodococcus koreensis]
VSAPNRQPAIPLPAQTSAEPRNPRRLVQVRSETGRATKLSVDRKRIEARRGRNIAKVAAARKLLTLVYYGLRDGHIRSLTRQKVA